MEPVMIHTPENGIKILARMIAEAYIEELSQQPLSENELKQDKEDDNANQRCDRSSKASQIGKGKTGRKKGKR
jgi:hypothetical protein